MKSAFKITAALAALSLCQTASAVDIYLTGSTAFRGGVHEAIISLMGGNTACKIAHSGTTADQSGYDGANYSTIQGTLSGIAGTSTVYCHWSGSTTGIHDLATANALTYIPTSSLPGSTGFANAAINQTPSGATAPNIAFSDVFQASSTTPTPALSDHKIAVVPFIWVANRGTTGITNITAQQARAVLSAGYQPKMLWTGNSADTDYVIEVGRDDGSGTRATMLAETKYGVFTALNQYKVTTTGTAGLDATVPSIQIWPADGSSVANLVGNGGYSSGSFIKAIMGATSTSSVEYYDETGADQGAFGPITIISSLGVGDAAGAISTNGAVKLTYEGSDLYNGGSSMDANQIRNGRYTLWGYEHLFTNGSPTGDLATFVSNIQSQFLNTSILGVNGIPLDASVLVQRQYDGAIVGP